MRENSHLFGRGLLALGQGDENEDALAAASNVADVLNLIHAYLTRE